MMETSDVWDHSIYGYVFLKNTTPLGACAESVLYHHLDYRLLRDTGSNYRNEAGLISLAGGADLLMRYDVSFGESDTLKQYAGTKYDPEFVDIFLRAEKNRDITGKIMSGEYKNVVSGIVNSLQISDQEAFDYLRMLIYAIDFRSIHTVTHTFNTVSISMILGEKFGLSEKKLEKLYYGALLHDTGKIAIPASILEKPDKLTPEEMAIMRTHVVISGEIIKNAVKKEIRDISVRHHEKIDGSGYPLGLTGDQMTLSQKIVAVADIMSALISTRSYKDSFPKEKTLSIIKEMMEKGQLSGEVCEAVLEDYDGIMKDTAQGRKDVMDIYSKIKTEVEETQKYITESLGSPQPMPLLLPVQG